MHINTGAYARSESRIDIQNNARMLLFDNNKIKMARKICIEGKAGWVNGV